MAASSMKTLKQRKSSSRDVHATYGLPTRPDLTGPGVLRSTLDRFLAVERAIEGAHRKLVHRGIAARYQHASDLRDDPEAFAIWMKEPRIVGLPRPPKQQEDSCRALFRATYENPSDASKRFKRIEPLWKKGEPVSAVVAYLEKHGLQDPPRRSASKQKVKDEETGLQENADAAASDGKLRGPREPANTLDCGVSGSTSGRVGDRALVRILNAPGNFVAHKKVGDVIAVTGCIVSIDNDAIVIKNIFYG